MDETVKDAPPRAGALARAADALRHDRRNVLIVAGVALLVRAVFFAAYSPVLTNDSHGYLELAHRLGGANLTGYDGLRTPGYPLLLVLLGYSPRAVWAVQSLLGVATAVLLYRLVRQLAGAAQVALIAALWYAISLVTLSIERELMTETLATLLLTGSASLALSVIRDHGRQRGLRALLSLLLAAFCLTRPDAILVSVYLLVTTAVLGRGRGGVPSSSGWRLTVRSAGAMLLPILIVVVGWACVNRVVTGVFTISTVTGHNTIDHVAPQVTVERGRDRAITSVYVAERARAPSPYNVSYAAWGAMEHVSHLSYAHLSARLLAIGLDVTAHHPLAYVRSSVRQWPSFWLAPRYVKELPGTDRSSVLRALSSPERALQAVFGLGFLVICLLDVVLRLRRRRGILSRGAALLAGAVLIASLQAVFLAYGETGRYGLPYVPLLLAVTLATAVPEGGSLRRRRS